MIFEIQGQAKEQRRIRMRFDVANQFDCEGEWLRGNLHCHVRQMGGAEKICAFYRNLGYHFLASTDYTNVTAMPKATDDFITLHGAEMHGVGKAHVICIGLQDDVRPPQGSLDDVVRMIRDVETMGGVAILAHPYWCDFNWEELLQIVKTGVSGFEISNRLCWRINGKERSEELWQLLLGQGIRLAAIGVDDAHAPVEEIPEVAGHTWTGALVSERTPEGIIDAIRSRRTYASEGPSIRSIRFESRGAIVVECSECVACHFTSRGFGVRSICAEEGAERFEVDLTCEGYRLKDWLVVCLEDKGGRRAWSSAIPVHVEIHEV